MILFVLDGMYTVFSNLFNLLFSGHLYAGATFLPDTRFAEELNHQQGNRKNHQIGLNANRNLK